MQLNKVFLGIGLVMISATAMAQSYASAPRDVSIPQPGLVYPSYSSPVNASLQPTVDAASYTYLRWMGSNVQLLVNYADFFYQLQKSEGSTASGAYMAPITALANLQAVTMGQENWKKSAVLTQKNVVETLAFGDESTLKIGSYANIPGTDIVPPPGGDALPDMEFNADWLLGRMGFMDDTTSPKEVSPINSLVMFLSGGAKPLGGLTFSKDADERKKQLAGSDVQSYLVDSRIAAAGQSVSYANLNYLAQERRVIKNLGAGGGMTTLPTDGNAKSIPDASQLELEKFLIERRVGNASWYTNMNTASSISVQRETLFVLAEISKQMFEQKILMERMLAQQIAMQTQSAQLNRTKLDYDRQNVQKNLASTDAGA